MGRPKARCVARGFQDQREDIDSNSPAASGDSRRCFIATARARRLCVGIADVKQAYLNADLNSKATVYLIPPTGYAEEGVIWQLTKAVYGLADAGALWYECISSRLQAQGWKRLPEDPCIYVRDGMLAVLYVDDLLVAAETYKEASKAVTDLNFELGKGRPIVNGDDFAGVTIQFNGPDFQVATDLVLTQKNYAKEDIPDPVWKRTTTTPLPTTVVAEDPEKKVNLSPGEHKAYRGIVGKIMWLACVTRPDIAYAAAFLSRSLAAPTARDFQLADRCAAYIKQTAEFCLHVPPINWEKAEIVVISDASHAAPRDDFRSQSGYVVLLTDRIHCVVLAWKSTTQKRVVTSSMAAECFAAQQAWRHALHLRQLLLGMDPSRGTLKITCATDNDDLYKIVKIRKRSVPKDRSLTICVHVLRESVDLDNLLVDFVPGKVNPADALTKPLSNMDTLLDLMKGMANNLGKSL